MEAKKIQKQKWVLLLKLQARISSELYIIPQPYLSGIDDDVDGAVGDEHQVVPPGEVIRPLRPELYCAVVNHLGRKRVKQS